MSTVAEIPRILPGGVHVWEVPAQEPALGMPGFISEPSVLPAEYVKEASRKLRVRKSDTVGDPDRLEIRLPGGARVLGDDPELMKEAAVYFSEAVDMLIRSLGPGRLLDTKPFTLSIYSQHADFKAKARSLGAGNAQSLYDPVSQRIEMDWKTQAGAHYTRFLFHEATHAYMDLAYGTTRPLWLAEGCAELFSDWVWQGLAAPGVVFRPILGHLPDPPMELGRFMKLSRDEMYSVHFAQHYAQAWSLAAYLNEHDPRGLQWLVSRKGSVPINEAAYLEFYGELLRYR